MNPLDPKTRSVSKGKRTVPLRQKTRSTSKGKKIVLLGMMSRMAVGGNIWLVLHYLLGLKRLGYAPYYVEAHGWPPTRLMQTPGDDGWQRAADLIHGVMKRFDLADRWAYHAVDDGHRYYGMTRQQLEDLYRSAEAIINLHGGTELLPEHLACPVRIYLETDPVDVEVHVHNGVQKYKDLLASHTHHFTWGTNYGHPGCLVPLPEGVHFTPTLPPVILDLWDSGGAGGQGVFTTIGNWRSRERKGLRLNGEVYHWSKHREFQRFLDLPRRSGQEFELALSGSSYNGEDRQQLARHGWRVRDALTFSTDPDAYRSYIRESRGEFTVAKDQNVRLKSGWFSERSAQYLAAGRPVITQETGFSNALPTGEGLFGFSTLDEILAAVQAIRSDYGNHCRAALEVARTHFNYDVVLPQLLAPIGALQKRKTTMNADRINEHYYGDPTDAATERARQRIHWMCSQAVGRDVLDIGCSQGILCLILGREGFRCVGIDIESASLDIARQALAKEDQIVQRRVTFQVADASELPLEDTSFDTVVLGEVIEHLTHPLRVLSEAKRVLRNEGRLIVTVPYGLNAFHDHKRTYYPISLLELLQPLFRTSTIETQGNYIIYTGIKDPAYDPSELSAEDLFEPYLRLANTVQARCLEKERALFETGKTLHAKIKTLTAKAAAHADTIKELNASIAAKDGQLRDLTTTSPQAGQASDTQPEAAKQRERRLLETNRELQGQVEALTAKAASRATGLEELERALGSKERHIREIELRSEQERQQAAMHRDAAARKEQELLETSRKLQEQVQELSSKAAAQAGRLEELEIALRAKERQVRELELDAQSERELHARHRETAAKKEQRLLESNTSLQDQVEGLTAQRAAHESKLAESEKTLAAKLQQIRELEFSFEQAREQATTHRETAARREQELLESSTQLQARIQDLTAKAAAQKNRLEQLEEALGSKERQIHELVLTSEEAREQAAMHRETAARREQELLETSTRLQSQVEGLTAEAAAQANTLKKLEEELATKERQIQEIEVNGEQARELAATHRALADANAALTAEKERLQSLQAEIAQMRQDLAAKDATWQERIDRAEALNADRLRAREKYFQEIMAKREAEWHRKDVNRRIRELARASLPADAHVLVISKGDDEMLQLDGRHGQHFPQAAGGVYAGYHPANAADAIAHLEALKGRGAQFLLIPASSLWWLEYYAEFRQHLEANGSLLLYEEQSCAIYTLTPPVADRSYRVEIASRNGEAIPQPRPTEPQSATRGRRALSPPNEAVESPNGAKRVSLGVILDEFTTGCIRPECRLVTFRPDNWRKILEEDLPDALFVESAWRGNDGSWQYRIANYARNMGDELIDLLDWARKRAIPSVFWNKEDPVHFDRFIDRAQLFSHVFTTDANCVARYQQRLGHDRVFALPFAAQPAIHNPVQTEDRTGAVCFAGTYYGSRHKERQTDMDFILRPAVPFGLEIYDRQHGVVGKGADTFRFPDIYQPCIKGRLDYDEMVKAYKRYRVFLNVNSVKQSPTMFSRRVFELLASGTPVISTYSAGIVELLGDDVVFLTESESETRRHLERLLGDDDEWARASARGIRKVMREHTYGYRLRDLSERIGITLPTPKEPQFTVIVGIGSETELLGLAPMLADQSYRRFDVMLRSDMQISTGGMERLRNAIPAVSIINVVGSPPAVFSRCRESAADYLAFLDLRDSYGPDYLLDHALAVQYSGTEFIGKHTFYQMGTDGGRHLKQLGHEFKYVTSVQSATLVAKKSAVSKELFLHAAGRRVFHPRDRRILSIDRFNYLQNAFAGGTLEPGRVGAALRHVEVHV